MKRCSTCHGPFHEATGHAFTATCQLCHCCAGRFFAWVVRHTSRREGKKGGKRKHPCSVSFYEAAATSVRAGWEEVENLNRINKEVNV